ncbi:thiamine phosphate synthase [Variovorax sp. J31P207]|uniref:thiamine phosphate synthase n=1 Tax=Variovorax sp. J31P207 TaxID=3053510 RepID=UPI002578D6E7|nr:thiamine phosphate synthase [Variovorax sp. J31P207]MDM0071939.1 thiamine phosphate synthase [Variovorax sp. J31P207]
MNTMNDATSIARAILAAHAARFGATSNAADSFTSDDPIYRGAKQACGTLGFIDIDAECLARAWRAQSERNGRFDAEAWPDTPADFGLRSFPPTRRDDAFPPCPEKLGLYAVLPDAQWVGRMARAGVPTVQLRFKSDDAGAIEREVQAAVEAVRVTGALLFINDHWKNAIAARAYGLHLGQEDLDALAPAELRAIRDSGIRLGVSTHGYAEMLRADLASPSYIAMGAVYPTTLKRMATAPQGVARLAAYARLMRGYPQVGIGGVDEERMPEVLATGVGSVAVVRALVADPQPEEAARRLLAICNRAA